MSAEAGGIGAAEMRIEERAKAAEKAWRADLVESVCGSGEVEDEQRIVDLGFRVDF